MKKILYLLLTLFGCTLLANGQDFKPGQQAQGILTGAADVQHAVLAMKSGGADYIARSYQPDILLPRIREALHTGTLQPTAAGASSYHLYNVRIRHKMSQITN